MTAVQPLEQDLEVQTIEALSIAFTESINDDASHVISAKHAKFNRMARSMFPALKEAVALLAAIHEADNRVFETGDESDDRDNDMQAAIGKASLLLDKLNAKVASKEGHVVRGLRKAIPYHGNNCPACGNDDISSTSNSEMDDGYCSQEAKCQTCTFEWTDIYVLSSISIKDDEKNSMTEALNAAGISVYKSETHGYGFTFCEADNYETEDDALLSAWHYFMNKNHDEVLS